MTPSLKISQQIITRLSGTHRPDVGKLYGVLTKNDLVVVGLQLDTEELSLNNLVNALPAEIYVCGIIHIGNGHYNEAHMKQRLAEVYVTDNPILLNFTINSDEISASLYISGQLEPTTFAPITEQEILSQFLYTRLQGDLPLSCEVSVEAIQEALLNLRKAVASGVMCFGFRKTNILLVGNTNETGFVGVEGNPSLGEICEQINDPSEVTTRKKKQQNFEIDVLKVNILKRATIEMGEVLGTKNHAPLCVLDKKQCKTLSFTVSVDTLAMIHRQTKVANVYEILVESAIRNLRLLENTLINAFKRLEGNFTRPETFHFYPQDCGQFITRIYLKGDSEESLLPERTQLHKELLLKMTRPFFKRANAFIFKKNQSGAPLTNPHESIKYTDNGGMLRLVKGQYSYYHYCQNRMDDNGWGCAYRSLQTLASWFKLQGYTEREVPSYSDIQKCLVEIGDKPKTFVGSKQWIGSTEVNFVLDSLLGVTSKILYVSSGEDMAAKGPELVNHFENHGSPIMIGGGVLAHTILGVDYNPQSGALKFLILDPHYTGGEDVHTIVSKGWCGWKGVDFWNKTAYYNMCLPQVPIGI